MLTHATDGLLKSGAEKPNTIASMNSLSNVYHDAGRHSEAVTIFQKLLPILKRIPGTSDHRVADVQARLGLSLIRCGRFAEAEPILRDCLAARLAGPPKSPLVYDAH